MLKVGCMNKEQHCSVFLITLFLGMAFMAIFQGCSPELQQLAMQANTQQGWKTVKDPHGFELSTPTGYIIEVSPNGIVSASKGESTAVIEAVVSDSQKNSAEFLDYTVPLIKKVVGDIEIISVEQLPDYPNAYVAKVKQGSKIGAILLVMDGTKGFIAGMFDDADKYNATITDLVKIISSFKYDNSIKSPEKVEKIEKSEGAAETEKITQLKEWKDPKEGAFTINVPEGWKISSDSGITRQYIDASVKIVMTKDESGISIEQLHPPLYYTPNWVLQMSGITEGSSYANGIVKSYRTAEQYLKDIAPAELGLGAPADAKQRPDLVAGIYRAQWIKETTAAEATFREDTPEKTIIHKVIAAVEYYELAGTGMWAVSMVHYWAPETEIEKVAEIADKVMASFKLDSSWGAREQQQVAARTGLISAAGNDIANTIKSTFELRDAVMDSVHKEFSNAILGIQEIYDPMLGEQYTVPNDAEYYWKYFDKIIGTETYENILNDPNLRPLYCPMC